MFSFSALLYLIPERTGFMTYVQHRSQSPAATRSGQAHSGNRLQELLTAIPLLCARTHEMALLQQDLIFHTFKSMARICLTDSSFQLFCINTDVRELRMTWSIVNGILHLERTETF